MSHTDPLLTVSSEEPGLRSSLVLSRQESSCVRELSILLCKDAMEVAEGTHETEMKKQVQSTLLPLFFHLHDQNQCVAQVGISKLSGRLRGQHPSGGPAHQGHGLLARLPLNVPHPGAEAPESRRKVQSPSVRAPGPPQPFCPCCASTHTKGQSGGASPCPTSSPTRHPPQNSPLGGFLQP